MLKQKGGIFSEKFHLLNSQENAEEINWSSSESCEFENVPNVERLNTSNKVQNRKRKRKKKVLKNISNLNVTIIDVPKDHKDIIIGDNPPISDMKSAPKSLETSPVFPPTPLYFPLYKCSKVEQSPILTSKSYNQKIKPDLSGKSPILVSKFASPKGSPTVRKKLFKADETFKIDIVKDEAEIESLTARRNNVTYLDKRKDTLTDLNKSKPQFSDKKSNSINYEQGSRNLTQDLLHNEDQIMFNDTEQSKLQENVKTDESTLDDSSENSKTSLDLAKKIKSYFDSHFSSENNSQHSISESLTPKHSSKTSEDIDIISSITQVDSSKQTSELESKPSSKTTSPLSSQSAEINTESKKIRYKKHGLAHRLNALLKKQNASISLWQHERFLAENSHFVLPKGENIVFRIRKVNFEYGCYLLKVVDVDNDECLILINGKYVCDTNLLIDMIFKLYEPYKILDFNSYKLITNVCKFECIHKGLVDNNFF